MQGINSNNSYYPIAEFRSGSPCNFTSRQANDDQQWQQATKSTHRESGEEVFGVRWLTGKLGLISLEGRLNCERGGVRVVYVRGCVSVHPQYAEMRKLAGRRDLLGTGDTIRT